jgi:hypothetical protein
MPSICGSGADGRSVMGAPLSPSEIARRNEVAHAARAVNGALHQDEPLPSRLEPDISPVDVWVMTETGLRRWRPIIDQLTVTPLPNGERILDIGGHRLRLNEALAAHVAKLLWPSVDREGR